VTSHANFELKSNVLKIFCSSVNEWSLARRFGSLYLHRQGIIFSVTLHGQRRSPKCPTDYELTPPVPYESFIS